MAISSNAYYRLRGGLCPEVLMKNVPVYHSGMRELQDLRDTRRIADRLAAGHLASAVQRRGPRAFIERSRMFFVATADEHGSPDCSYKGGMPGFVDRAG